MKVSILTVAYNSGKTLEHTIQSVLTQSYHDIEYIIIDGASSDNSVDIIRRNEQAFNGRLVWRSEKDRGIYDAMNKGIKLATGDVVGILNSDDFFTSNDVIERMVMAFSDDIDAVYGDVHFVRNCQLDKCVRYYSSKRFSPKWLRFGFMPAHPSFYCRRAIFEKAGYYKTDYTIGSDYEMMVRLFIVYKIRAKYVPMDFVTMRTGGTSTRSVRSRLQLIADDVRGCRENGLYSNALMVSMKYLYKIFEFRV